MPWRTACSGSPGRAPATAPRRDRDGAARSRGGRHRGAARCDLVVPAGRRRARLAGQLGRHVGYVLGAHLADHPSGRSLLLFWGLASIVVGPLLGIGAHWLRSGAPVRAALGVGGMAGILVGEGIYGLTTVAATTSSTYWSLEIAAGVFLLGWALVRRLSRRDGAVAVVTALVAVLLVVAFRADLVALL
ncbi:MAG: DUF6518 family protein [Nocardioidaceae bacterium]